MNRKQLLLILVVGLVLGGIGLYLNRQKSESFQRTEKIATDRLLGDFAINDVRQISVQQSTGAVNLVKGDVWTVKERFGYPANTDEIIEFARKLWDLRAAQSQQLGASQLERLELIAPDKGGTNSATLVDMKDKDGKPIRSILFGKKSMRDSGGGLGGGGWPNGRWVYRPDKPGVAYLVSEAFTEVEPKPERWLNKDFFKVEKIRSVSLTSTNATNSWKLVRESESGEWKMADLKPGEQLDAPKASGLNYALSSPSFNDVLAPDTKPEQSGLDHPLAATIETFDNFTYTLQIGTKTNEDNIALKVAVNANITKERAAGQDEKPEDKTKLDKEFQEKVKKLEDKLKQEKAYEQWTYLVSKWTVDPVLKERKDFLAEKKEEKKDEVKPEDKTPEFKPDAGNPFDIKPADAKPLAPKPAEAKPPEIKPEVKPAEPKAEPAKESPKTEAPKKEEPKSEVKKEPVPPAPPPKPAEK